MPIRQFIIGIPVMCCIFLAVSGCVKEEEEPVVSLGVGDAVPRFSVTLNDGSVFDFSVMQQYPCVVVFFDTSCPDCRAALPIVQTVSTHKSFTSKDIRFVCIARAEGEASIASFWETEHLTLPYSPQSDRSVYNLFANSVIPRIYVTTPRHSASTNEDAPNIPVISAVFVEHLTEDSLVSALHSL